MSDDKPHAPTQRRLQKAREDGSVAVSRELSMLVSLSAGAIALSMQGSAAAVTHWLAACLQQTRYTGLQVWGAAVHSLMLGILPTSLAAIGGYAAATVLQTGFLFHGAAIKADFKKLSPLAGLKRMIGPQAAVTVFKAVVKLGLLGGCLYSALHAILPGLVSSP